MQTVSLTPPVDSDIEETELFGDESFEGYRPDEATQIVANLLSLNEGQINGLRCVLEGVDADAILLLQVKPEWEPEPPLHSDQVMDAIAVWRLSTYRRDALPNNFGYRWLFRFRSISEIVKCQSAIKQKYPGCFGVSKDLIAMGHAGPDSGKSVMADAVIISKVSEDGNDVFPFSFFES